MKDWSRFPFFRRRIPVHAPFSLTRALHALAALALFALAPAARASTGFTTSDTLGSGDAGKNLVNGTVYVVPQDATIERPSHSANSALYVQNDATAVIYIPSGVTLTVKGGNAQGKEGAGGGIRQLLDNVAGVLDNLPADENKRAEVTEILDDLVEGLIRSTAHLKGELSHRLGGELMID